MVVTCGGLIMNPTSTLFISTVKPFRLKNSAAKFATASDWRRCPVFPSLKIRIFLESPTAPEAGSKRLKATSMGARGRHHITLQQRPEQRTTLRLRWQVETVRRQRRQGRQNIRQLRPYGE